MRIKGIFSTFIAFSGLGLLAVAVQSKNGMVDFDQIASQLSNTGIVTLPVDQGPKTSARRSHPVSVYEAIPPKRTLAAQGALELPKKSDPNSCPLSNVSEPHVGTRIDPNAKAAGTEMNSTASLEKDLNQVASKTEESMPKESAAPSYGNSEWNLLDSARMQSDYIQESAKSDERYLDNLYQNIPGTQVGKYLDRARDGLSRNIETLRKTTGGSLATGDRQRFANVMENALAKVERAQEIVQEDNQRAREQAMNPLAQLFNNGNPLAKSKGLEEVFNPRDPMQSATNDDRLSDRQIMYEGLPENEKDKALSNLKLAEPVNLAGAPASGGSAIPGQISVPGTQSSSGKVVILHNGYIYGAGDTGVDCSSFVSTLLQNDFGGARLTTLDLWGVWQYLHSGNLPKPPKWDSSREKLIQNISRSFVPVDLYQNERLYPGDLLVFRRADHPAGHVFLIKNYDPEQFKAEVVEASQSAGTIRERNFYTVFKDSGSEKLYYIPGLTALRLKSMHSSSCKVNVAAK